MKMLLVGAAALLVLSGCAPQATAGEPVRAEATPAPTLVPIEEVPAGILAKAIEAGLGSDEKTAYENAAWTCVIMDNTRGDYDELAWLHLNEMKATPEQTETVMVLAAEHLCPGLADGFDEWRASGGFDRLDSLPHPGTGH